MTNVNKGGNPVLDKKESVERFNKFVEPIFNQEGFCRLNKKSHTLINTNTKSIVITTAAPSQYKFINDIKFKVKEFKKKYEGYSVYILFTRNFEEWSDKTVYMNTLKKTQGVSGLNGIVIGIDKLVKLINSTKNNNILYLIG
jgi:hypothetical protein